MQKIPAHRGQLVGPAKLADKKRAFQIEFLREMGLSPSDTLLDLGCGVLRGGIPLIEYLDSGHYSGLEISWIRLREGQSELQRHGLEHKGPHLYGSYDDLVAAGACFDLIWSYQVLIHMTDEIVRSALGHVAPLLKPDGRFFATVFIGDRAEGSWMEYPCVTRPLSFYQDLGLECGLDVELVPYSHPMLNNQMVKFTALSGPASLGTP